MVVGMTIRAAKTTNMMVVIVLVDTSSLLSVAVSAV
jgi:hypothetical protein